MDIRHAQQIFHLSKRVFALSLFFCITYMCVGCTTTQSTLSSLNARYAQNQLTRDGRVHTQLVEVTFRGKSLTRPIFLYQNQFHVAGYQRSVLQLTLRNRTAQTVSVSIEHVDTQGHSTQKEITLAAYQRVDYKALQFPQTVRAMSSLKSYFFPRVAMRVTQKTHSRPTQVLRFAYNNCRSYEQLSICPPTCLCAARHPSLASTGPTKRVQSSRTLHVSYAD